LQIVCTSRISGVVVHARGALVSRRVDVPALPEGDVELLIPDVTVLADGGSVRATVGGGRSVTGVRTALHVPETPVAPGESVELVRALTGRIERLAAEKERLSTHRTRLDGLDVHPRLRYAARAPRRGADIASRTADALASAALIAEIVERLDARLLEIDDAVRDLERQLEAARLADAQAKSRARMGQGHPTRRITVQLAGSGRVEALELAYVVPAARWWPSYTLRMADDGRRATWTIEALVAQLTGEDWTGVALSLSTADLIHDARLPELASRRLGRAQPPPKRSYRPAPSGLEQMFAGYDRAFGAASRGLKVEAPAPARMTLRPEEADEPLDAMAAEEELTNPGDTRAAALGGAAVAKAPRAFALPAPGMAPAGVLTPVPPPAQAARRMALARRRPDPGEGRAGAAAGHAGDRARRRLARLRHLDHGRRLRGAARSAGAHGGRQWPRARGREPHRVADARAHARSAGDARAVRSPPRRPGTRRRALRRTDPPGDAGDRRGRAVAALALRAARGARGVQGGGARQPVRRPAARRAGRGLRRGDPAGEHRHRAGSIAAAASPSAWASRSASGWRATRASRSRRVG
jgi:hypothetical protein